MARRLRAQRLIGAPFSSPIDVVRWFGAVQSQDYGGAKWALAQRTRGATDAELDRLFDDGEILRTHVMRQTWHFVLPEDIRWMLELTGPRVRAGAVARHRQLEIDESVVTRAESAFEAALTGGRHLTRTELGDVLGAAAISPEGQRLPHLLAAAELDGLIVSGPRRGKQFTYALLDERTPKARALDRSEALVQLARRYFRGHGPAQLKDFVWWSGLTVADARSGIALAGSALDRHITRGKEYWFDTAAVRAPKLASVAHLLPNFDEYTVGYTDRDDVHPDGPFDLSLFSFGSILSNVVTVLGRVRGSWRRSVHGRGTRVDVLPTAALRPVEVAAVERAAQNLARFLEHPVELNWKKA